MAEGASDRDGTGTGFEFNDRDFRRACRMIYTRAGIHLAEHKRDMVYSRLSRRIRARGLSSCADYLDLVEADPDSEEQAFINALTTNWRRCGLTRTMPSLGPVPRRKKRRLRSGDRSAMRSAP